MSKATLVIMAAGIGSRFGGGIKQLEPIGPNGEIIMDYSIYDAIQAGFEEVVFIIRKDLEQDFKSVIGDRIAKRIPVSYAFQELGDIPAGYTVPGGRVKPWGTGQAVLSIRGLVSTPFLVINADDYYGKEAFHKIYRYMTQEMNPASSFYDICMGGFILANTLSKNGGVTRGVCQVNDQGILTDVTETYDIQYRDGVLYAYDDQGDLVTVDKNQHVSMNMWGLAPSFLDEIERAFPRFLNRLSGNEQKAEFLLPQLIDQLVKDGRARVKVIETRDKWFGVTYKEDREAVVEAVGQLIKQGAYPENLY